MDFCQGGKEARRQGREGGKQGGREAGRRGRGRVNGLTKLLETGAVRWGEGEGGREGGGR